MKKIIFTTLILGGGVFSTLAYAQDRFSDICRQSLDTFQRIYDQKTIIYLPNQDAILNGKLIEHDIFEENGVENNLKTVDGAYEMYRRADRKVWTSATLNLVGISLFGGGLVGTAYAETRDERALSFGVLGTETVLLGIGNRVRETRLKGTNQAFHYYNRQILSQSLAQNGADCQNAFLKNFDENTIVVGRYNTYLQNGRTIKYGFGGSTLLDLMQKSPDALRYLHVFRKKNITAKALYLGAAVSFLTGATLQGRQFAAGKEPNILSQILFYGGIPLYLQGSFLDARAKKNLHQAVWHFNRDALLRSSISKNLDEIE